MTSKCYDTIIIGLGAAGVTAASTLARFGRRVLALEAMDRIGGRIHTVPFGDGLVELGAEWVHGSNPSRTFDTAKQNNITLVPQDLVFTAYLSNGTKLPEEYNDDFRKMVEFMFTREAAGSDCDEPLGEFLTRELMEHLKSEKPELLKDKEFINMALEWLNQLTNNYNASNDWNDVNVRSRYEEIDGHHHLSWHKYGYRKFLDLLLNKEMGFPTLDIKLNTEVSRIEWPRDTQDKVVVTCTYGNVYTARYVIVTVSLGVLKERHATLFNPELPKEKIAAIEKISMGVMDKVDLAFDEPWWPLDAVFFAFFWKEEDKKRIPKDDNWTTQVFAASRPMGAKNVLTLWTSGNIGKLVETLPLDEVKTKCRAILQRFMGSSSFTVPEPKAIERSTWYANPYTRGSYSFDSIHAADYPLARTHLAAPLKDKAQKPCVFFAGEATHEIHFSTVHGASDTGYRQAIEILENIGIVSKI